MCWKRSLCFATSWWLQRQCKSDASVCLCLMLPCYDSIRILVYSQAKCIKTGPGTHTCQCLSGWKEDGDECQAINKCLDPSRGGCHSNATCIYVGPGQVRGCCDSRTPSIWIYKIFDDWYSTLEWLCVQKWLPRQWEGLWTCQSVCGAEGWMSFPGEGSKKIIIELHIYFFYTM